MSQVSPRFNNRFINNLPADSQRGAGVRQVHGAAYSFVEPTEVRQPELIAWSAELAAELGVDKPKAGDPSDLGDSWVRALSGNKLLPGMQPYAMAYGGHQFGNWAGQLGDGRAIALGELLAPCGASYELQLKGAGPTPYSRTADGRAVLRSSIREFICSEAMFHLGVPTTRALSLIKTGDAVVRDMFYDGRAAPEPGAIVCRVAASFIRFGSFELPASRGDTALLQQWVDYCLAEHFPEIDRQQPDYLAQWFKSICESTAEMVVHWMRVGFVHGVMNTDNMSIHSLTIDYGPYGWLEPYDPSWTPNTTDAQGRRYSYGNQPGIAQWNLTRLGSALAQLVDDIEPLQQALEAYRERYEPFYCQQFSAKLGLPALEKTELDTLLNPLFDVLQAAEIDYCLFFRRLGNVVTSLADESAFTDDDVLALLEPAFYKPEMEAADEQKLVGWVRSYLQRVSDSGVAASAVRQTMDAHNPKYVPRNYLAQQAIEAAEAGDNGPLEELQQVLLRPYDEQPEFEHYAARRPKWAENKPGCSALSCSS